MHSPLFRDLDDDSTAYWLGFLMADGYNADPHLPGFPRTILKLSAADSDHVDAFAAWSASVTGRKTWTHTERASRPGENDRRLAGFFDRDLGHRLHDLGVHVHRVPNDTGRIPDQLPRNRYPSFVRGFFDGNGWVSQFRRSRRNGSPRPGYQTEVGLAGGPTLLNQIAEVLHRDAAVAPRKIATRGASAQLRYGRASDIVHLHSYLYRDAEVWLPRKRLLFDHVITSPTSPR